MNYNKNNNISYQILGPKTWRNSNRENLTVFSKIEEQQTIAEREREREREIKEKLYFDLA